MAAAVLLLVGTDEDERGSGAASGGCAETNEGPNNANSANCFRSRNLWNQLDLVDSYKLVWLDSVHTTALNPSSCPLRPGEATCTLASSFPTIAFALERQAVDRSTGMGGEKAGAKDTGDDAATRANLRMLNILKLGVR